MKTGYLIIAFILLLLSCKQSSTHKDELSKTLNKTITLDMFDTIQFGEYNVSYWEFRSQYKYLSIMSLQAGCGPCYPKFLEWNKEIQSIALASDYTTLFVINARDFEHFVIDAEAYEPIDNLYYYVIDSQNQFLSQNSDIPEWLIGQSLLVDHNNRVKLIGPPYSTDDMTKAFHDITGVN